MTDNENLEEEYNSDYEYMEDEDSGETVELSKNFAAPKNVDQFIDTAKGEVVDKSKLSYMDTIKATAKQHNITLKDPNSGCKKCYGRGYEYITPEGSPFPCTCITPTRTPMQKANDSRVDRRFPATQNRADRRKYKR